MQTVRIAVLLTALTAGVFLFIPQTHAASCTNTLTSTTAIPTGYGASYNLFTSTKELLVRSTCSNTTATLTLGSPNTYTYRTAYTWSGTAWQPHTLTCTGTQASSAWCIGEATANTTLTQNPTALLGYTCSWVNSSWKCGCRDTTCTTSQWQLQRVGVTAGGRDPLQEPFSSASIWNTAIGSNARYVPISLKTEWENSWAKIPGSDTNFIFLTPNAPLVDIYYSSAGWSGSDRCLRTNLTILGTVPMPSDFTVPNGRANKAAAFLMRDGRYIKQFQPLARCVAGGYATSLVGGGSLTDLYGDGIYGTHGGSGMSALGGTIRVGELRPGQTGPRHALSLTIQMKEAYACKTYAECYRWPAKKADTVSVNYYGTALNNPNADIKGFVMGALLAIPASVSLSSLGLETEPGRQLAWTLQNYGAYVVDQTGDGGSFHFTTELGPGGDLQTQFRNDWGYSFTQTQDSIESKGAAWVRDIKKLITHLAVVDNNTATTIGGGGTPRVPRKPEIYP